MVKKYYLDTSIWIDLYEDRKGYQGESLGRFAAKFLLSLLKKRARLVITDVLLDEISGWYSIEEITLMFVPFNRIIEKIIATEEQHILASKISRIRNLPPEDVLHALIAKDHNLVLVTRDNHFMKLKDICECFKPEDLL